MVEDHKGNKFKSMVEMCKYWGISAELVYRRLKYNWDLKEALEIKACTRRERVHHNYKYDHLGNKFNSIKAMCEHWGIPEGTFRHRINRGLSLKDALENNRNITVTGIETYDHLGNKFNSFIDMCKYWDKTDLLVNNRLGRGWSLEDALERPKKESSVKNIVYDHLGNEFNTKTDMCKYWGIEIKRLYSRTRNGWSLQEALETPVGETPKSKLVYDNLGNSFNTFKELCSYYNMPHNEVRARLKIGWSLEDALNIPIGKDRKNKAYYDHLGNKFNTLRRMCEYWNINVDTYLTRIKKGMSVKSALEEPLRRVLR